MKRAFSFLLFAVLSLPIYSQTATKLEQMLPDSAKYFAPNFGFGRITYKDGQYSMGKFNICTVDQRIRYIDQDGTEMMLRDNEMVDRVSIDGTLYLRHGDVFVALDQNLGDVYLCICRKLVFKDSKKAGFGAESSTTAIKTVSGFSGSGMFGDYSSGNYYDLQSLPDYVIKEVPYLYNNGRMYNSSKKSFMKLFKEKKEEIESYLSSHIINFQDYAQVLELWNAIN